MSKSRGVGHDGRSTQPPNYDQIERGTQVADEGPPPSLRLCEEGPAQESRHPEAPPETGSGSPATTMVRLNALEHEQAYGPQRNQPPKRQKND